MSWRLAESLIRLREQINEKYPNRSKVSDGTIGDVAHQAEGSASDHNPWVDGNVVTAFDVTHDPSGGVDIVKLAESLKTDSRVKYLIRNSQILVPTSGLHWQPYYGSNPHTSHLHISVNTHNYDNKSNWNIGDDMKLTKEQIIMIHKLAFQGLEPGPGLVQGWVGRELDDYVNALWSDPHYEKFVAGQRASKVNPATTPVAQLLKPGMYQVK